MSAQGVPAGNVRAVAQKCCWGLPTHPQVGAAVKVLRFSQQAAGLLNMPLQKLVILPHADL